MAFAPQYREIAISRTFGCLPDPRYVGTKYEIRILRVVGKTVRTYREIVGKRPLAV